MRKAIVLFVLLVAALSVPLVASAQTVTGLLSPAAGLSFFTALGKDTPAGTTFAGVGYFLGFATHVVGDTQALFGTSCENVAVYKVESDGKLGLWNFNKSCNGNTLSVTSEGNAHFVFFVVNSSASLPPIISAGAV